MSSIDPALTSRNVSFTSDLDQSTLDPATLLMALSAGQMNVLHDSLLLRVDPAKAQFDQLGKIGQASAKLTALQTKVEQRETDDAKKLLGELDALRSQQSSNGTDPIVVSPDDQAKYAKVMEWAQQRGFEGSPLLIEQAVPKPKSTTDADKTGDTPATTDEAKPETQTVLNQAAYLEFRDALRGYISSLKSGDVDNPAIRQQLTSDPEFQSLQAALKANGITDDIGSLRGITDAVKSLNGEFDRISKQLENRTDQIKVIVDEINNASTDLQSVNELQNASDRQLTDSRLDSQRDALKNLDLDKSQRERMEKILDTLASAERALDRSTIPPGQLDQLVKSMPIEQRTDFESQLSDWQRQFATRLESASRPTTEHRPLRANQTYV